MMRTILCLCFLFLTVSSNAQSRTIDASIDPRNRSEIFGLKSLRLLQKSSNLSRFEVLDTCRFMVIYTKKCIQDTLKREILADTMRLYVGSTYTAFFSNGLFVMDSIYTAHGCIRKYGGIDFYDGGFYYFLLAEHEMRVQNRIPFTNDYAIVYTQPTIPFAWRIDVNTIKQILGYDCMKAETRYGNRNWTAWFASDLPISCGPWKFSGLPGLILEATSADGEFAFDAIAIKPFRAPIKYYRWKEKTMTPTQWKLYERKLHTEPYYHFSNGGKVLFLTTDETAPKPYLDESWTAPYNPIEKE